jgi:hypothetical protein
MYLNKCTKCGAEFETKNPKRVICPNCLYPDRQDLSLNSYNNVLKQPEGVSEKQEEKAPDQFPPRPQQGGYSAGGGYHSEGNQNYNSPQRRPYPQQGGFGGPRPQQGGYGNQGGGYGRPQQGGFGGPRPQQGGYGNQGGSYGRPQQGGFGGPRPQQGGYGNQGGGYGRPPQQGGFAPQGGGFRRPPQQGGFAPQGGGFRRPPMQGGFNRGPGGFNRGGPRRPMASQKPLLISREQVAEIETLYKAMLPLPNPDCHEVIGQQMQLEPNKVFFGINLIRQKMFLPKLPYPKRKLAVSPEQLLAIQNLYTPLLPLPPIGCHKFISKQLKMDEWRVHVGIGIIRKQMDLPRWNPDRPDAPAEFKNQEKKSTKTDEK